MADDANNLSGLLNGLSRRLYYNETEISNEFMKNELYPNLSIEEFDKLIRQATNIIKSMVSTDMDFNQLEAFLLSQTKKREGGITQAQAKVYAKFWKNHKSKLHEYIVQSCTWNNSIKNISWRVDIQSQTRNINQLNTQTAIMELELASGCSNETDKIQFEMDESKMASVLKDLQEIDNEVKHLVNQ